MLFGLACPTTLHGKGCTYVFTPHLILKTILYYPTYRKSPPWKASNVFTLKYMWSVQVNLILIYWLVWYFCFFWVRVAVGSLSSPKKTKELQFYCWVQNSIWIHFRCRRVLLFNAFIVVLSHQLVLLLVFIIVVEVCFIVFIAGIIDINSFNAVDICICIYMYVYIHSLMMELYPQLWAQLHLLHNLQPKRRGMNVRDGSCSTSIDQHRFENKHRFTDFWLKGVNIYLFIYSELEISWLR